MVINQAQEEQVPMGLIVARIFRAKEKRARRVASRTWRNHAAFSEAMEWKRKAEQLEATPESFVLRVLFDKPPERKSFSESFAETCEELLGSPVTREITLTRSETLLTRRIACRKRDEFGPVNSR